MHFLDDAILPENQRKAGLGKGLTHSAFHQNHLPGQSFSSVHFSHYFQAEKGKALGYSN